MEESWQKSWAVERKIVEEAQEVHRIDRKLRVDADCLSANSR
jgi:hypothetical protein